MKTMDMILTALNRAAHSVSSIRAEYIAWRERRQSLTFKKDYWVGFSEKVFKDSAPVFVLSTGRCGTELLTNLFSKCDRVLVHHAPRPELLYSDFLAYGTWPIGGAEGKAAITASRFEAIADAYIRDRTYVETNFRITFFAYALADLFPHSKFIHLHRDPYSFAKSAVELGFYEGLKTDIGRILPTIAAADFKIEQDFQLARAAALWQVTNTWIEDFKKNIDSERIKVVAADKLFSDINTFESVADFSGLNLAGRRIDNSLLRNKKNAKTRSKKITVQLTEREISIINKFAPLGVHYGY